MLTNANIFYVGKMVINGNVFYVGKCWENACKKGKAAGLRKNRRRKMPVQRVLKGGAILYMDRKQTAPRDTRTNAQDGDTWEKVLPYTAPARTVRTTATGPCITVNENDLAYRQGGLFQNFDS